MKEFINGMIILNKALLDELNKISYTILSEDDYLTDFSHSGKSDWWQETLPIIKIYRTNGTYRSYIGLSIHNGTILCGSLSNKLLMNRRLNVLDIEALTKLVNLIDDSSNSI